MSYDPAMGRQKQNKPRRERPSEVRAIAGMLDLPSDLAGTDGGGGDPVVLAVAGIGFAGDGYETGTGAAYLRLDDGSVKLLPEALRAWARGTVAEDLALRGPDGAGGSLFPCRVEFGVADGQPLATRV